MAVCRRGRDDHLGRGHRGHLRHHRGCGRCDGRPGHRLRRPHGRHRRRPTSGSTCRGDGLWRSLDGTVAVVVILARCGRDRGRALRHRPFVGVCGGNGGRALGNGAVVTVRFGQRGGGLHARGAARRRRFGCRGSRHRGAGAGTDLRGGASERDRIILRRGESDPACAGQCHDERRRAGDRDRSGHQGTASSGELARRLWLTNLAVMHCRPPSVRTPRGRPYALVALPFVDRVPESCQPCGST